MDSLVDNGQTSVTEEEYFYRSSKYGAGQGPDIGRFWMPKMQSNRKTMSHKCNFKLSSWCINNISTCNQYKNVEIFYIFKKNHIKTYCIFYT